MSSNSGIDNLISEAIDSLTSAKSQHELDTIKSSYLGKRGSFTSLLKSIKDMKVEDKIIFGKKINIGKNKIIAHYDSLVNQLKATKLDNINSKNFDFTIKVFLNGHLCIVNTKKAQKFDSKRQIYVSFNPTAFLLLLLLLGAGKGSFVRNYPMSGTSSDFQVVTLPSIL